MICSLLSIHKGKEWNEHSKLSLENNLLLIRWYNRTLAPFGFHSILVLRTAIFGTWKFHNSSTPKQITVYFVTMG